MFLISDLIDELIVIERNNVLIDADWNNNKMNNGYRFVSDYSVEFALSDYS